MGKPHRAVKLARTANFRVYAAKKRNSMIRNKGSDDHWIFCFWSLNYFRITTINVECEKYWNTRNSLQKSISVIYFLRNVGFVFVFVLFCLHVVVRQKNSFFVRMSVKTIWFINARQILHPWTFQWPRNRTKIIDIAQCFWFQPHTNNLFDTSKIIN